MTNEIFQGQGTQPSDKDQGVLSQHIVDDADRAIVKHENFLALLKKQYGYTNDKAVDELQRLLKMFSTMNKSLGIHQARTDFKSSTDFSPEKGWSKFTHADAYKSPRRNP